MMIETRELGPTLWDDVVTLFGGKGACGGCWCMSWRVEKGEKWDAIKGDEAKARMEALVKSGKAHGILAYAAGEPVGWCAFGPRRDFSKLDRAPSLACDDADAVWSIPCFFVKAGHRGQGVAGLMLAHAERAIKARGGQLAEGYPAKPPADGKALPAAFAWTGPRAVFDQAGFAVVGNPDGGKQRVRKPL
ncbi:MAG: GCN5-related N-acetyltransferase [Cyanobacteria bacterium RYN_339]|nr:GCN5-related N-acetyltransferase [Cyanobacteria bacterium RYN_339]